MVIVHLYAQQIICKLEVLLCSRKWEATDYKKLHENAKQAG